MIAITAVVRVSGILIAGAASLGPQKDHAAMHDVKPTAYREIESDSPLPGTCLLREVRDVRSRVAQDIALPDVIHQAAEVKLVRLQENRTPCIGETIVDVPLWHVAIPGWRGRVQTDGRTFEDKYTRVLDIYLDPTTGQVLELRTRWPDEEPPIGAEPDSREAAKQMQMHREAYHSFAHLAPKVSFHEALQSLAQYGGNPFRAKQIVAHYVIWSEENAWWAEPRPVWAITLRGVEMRRRRDPGVRRYNWRAIIDATTGKYLCDTNIPKNIETPEDGG